MNISNFKLLFLLTISMVFFMGCGAKKGITGKYRHDWFDGRHGFHHIINLKTKKFSSISWKSNFLRPTQVEIKGFANVMEDSILLTPYKVFFFRRDKEFQGKFKKVNISCDSIGFNKLDKEGESYIKNFCSLNSYLLKSDTLINVETEMVYVLKRN